MPYPHVAVGEEVVVNAGGTSHPGHEQTVAAEEVGERRGRVHDLSRVDQSGKTEAEKLQPGDVDIPGQKQGAVAADWDHIGSDIGAENQERLSPSAEEDGKAHVRSRVSFHGFG